MLRDVLERLFGIELEYDPSLFPDSRAFTEPFKADIEKGKKTEALAAFREGVRQGLFWLLMTATLGSTFLGAPLVGWLSESAGPRWALGIGAIGGIVAGVIGWLGARREAKAPAAAPALETTSA